MPCPWKNILVAEGGVEIKPHFKPLLHRWGGTGRDRASPHIKTFLRTSAEADELKWFVLTSHNFGTYSWGGYEKNKTQWNCEHFECGVLFLPHHFVRDKVGDNNDENNFEFSNTPLHDKLGLHGIVPTRAVRFSNAPKMLSDEMWESKRGGAQSGLGNVVICPVPYSLPPNAYSADDLPWNNSFLVSDDFEEDDEGLVGGWVGENE